MALPFGIHPQEPMKHNNPPPYTDTLLAQHSEPAEAPTASSLHWLLLLFHLQFTKAGSDAVLSLFILQIF